MSGPKRLGVDIGAIDGKAVADEALRRIPDCPGALLRLSRSEYVAFERCGERFVTPQKDVPADKRGEVRVSCRNEVMWAKSSMGNGRVIYGLCASCHGMEERQRIDRRERSDRREAAE